MVESRRCGAFVGMVVGGRCASWCRQPMGRRSRLNPCMAGWFCVGRLACGPSFVGSFFLQQFGLYTVVLAAVWLVGLCVVGSIALQPAPAQLDVVLVVFSVCSELCCGLPVRYGGHCVATGVCPARCVGSPFSWPPVVGLFRVVRWPVWAWPVAFGRCRPSPTPFVSRRACFVQARPTPLHWLPHALFYSPCTFPSHSCSPLCAPASFLLQVEIKRCQVRDTTMTKPTPSRTPPPPRGHM